MNYDRRRIVTLMALAAVALTYLAGCESFIADGDSDTGVNARGGFFYLLDNESGRLVMLDQKLVLVDSWPYSEFTAESYVQGLTYDGFSLWASISGNDDALVQLDLAASDTIEVPRTLPAPPTGQGTVRDIAWDGSVFWVLNSGSATYGNPPQLFQIDPENGDILTVHDLPSAEPRALCYVESNADAYGTSIPEGLYYTDKDDDLIYIFDKTRLIFLNGFAAPVGPRGVNYVYPLGLFFDGEGFWSTNSSSVADYLFALDVNGVQMQSVTLPYGQPGALVWLERDLRIAMAPLVTAVTPNTGGPTAHKTVTVRGTGFRDGLTIDFGDGVAVDSLSYVDMFEVKVYITIAADAELGPRDITVTNPDNKVGVGADLYFIVDTDPSTGFIWFLDDGTDTLNRFSISEQAIVASYDTTPAGASLQGLVFDGTNLWIIAAGSDDQVAKIDTTGGVVTVLDVFEAPLNGTGTARDAAYDSTDFWIPNDGTDSIYRVAVDGGEVLETIPSPDIEPRGTTWADGKLYCNDKGTDLVYVWDPDAAAWSEVFSVPIPPDGPDSNPFPTGMAWDGISFWLCNSSYEFDYIYQVSPDGTLLNAIVMPNRGDSQPTGVVFTQK